MESPIAAQPVPQNPKSITHLDTMQPSPTPRSRASTLQNGTVQMREASVMASPSVEPNQKREQGDIFEKSNLISGAEGSFREMEQLDSPSEIPEGFDELPIELISLIDRFVESLGAKIHITPPSIEKLSDIFQDFYLRAEASIATHISSLAAKQNRVASPNPSISSKSSLGRGDGAAKKPPSRKGTSESSRAPNPEQQMLTPQEITERRKARRLLDRKGTALEEAVERMVCERVYNRIWRHKSTLDEVRDEKLRSRTAALALVGIGLQDLGIDLETSYKDGQSKITFGSEIDGWIAKARDGLLRMNEAQYPLGKLQQLAAAHKCIVDLLTALHQSSSSADEILPTLIYTLITTPPEGINVISNLHFIQRFRAASKVNGEAAYCLVNLEAAITFLETVDLASLRADEALEGPPKSSSGSSTPLNESKSEWLPKPPTSAPSSTPSPAPTITASSAPPLLHPHGLPLPSSGLAKPEHSKSPSHSRRLSNLFQPPASALGAASDAVRNTADQGFKTIGHTLDSSFKLLFGRLQEHKVVGDGTGVDGAINVPRTLDDVRTLVQPKSDDDEDSLHETVLQNRSSDDSLLSAIVGRKPIPRDRSADSIQSSGIAQQKVAPTSIPSERTGSAGQTRPAEPTNPGMAAVESMRNLGSSLNPLRGFGGMTSLRGFGRTTSSESPTPPISTSPQASGISKEPSKGESLDSVDDLPPVKVAPPIPRFLEVKSVGELRMGEVADLLQDYKRLARALDQMGAL